MLPAYPVYLWQQRQWPRFTYDSAALGAAVATVSRKQGLLLGRLAESDDDVRDAAALRTLTEDVVETSAIEGELLDVASVRSSIARRLGVDIGALAPADRHADGVVEMALDATACDDRPVTAERLFDWHAGLFPTGRAGISRIRVGEWRDDSAGPMQVVSGPYGRQRVHYQAPPADRLDEEMCSFLEWFNTDPVEPMIVRAGLAHLWFVTIHPFDDGNGRIARALGDFWLARADGTFRRFYSLSAQIQREHSAYYTVLERTQRGSMDVTVWLEWFLGTLDRALGLADESVDAVLTKARLWRTWSVHSLNPRQIAMLNRLLDGFAGKLTTAKWAKLTKSSHDTALRDINGLVTMGVLTRSSAGGRNTSYDLRSRVPRTRHSG